MWKKLCECPVCGDRLIVEKRYQFVQQHRIKKDGQISKGSEKFPVEYAGINSIFCIKCDFETDSSLVPKLHPDIRIEENDEEFIYDDGREQHNGIITKVDTFICRLF